MILHAVSKVRTWVTAGSITVWAEMAGVRWEIIFDIIVTNNECIVRNGSIPERSDTSENMKEWSTQVCGEETSEKYNM